MDFMRMRRKIPMRVMTHPTMLFTKIALRINVNHNTSDVGKVVQNLMPNLFCDFVSFFGGSVAPYSHYELDVQLMPHPASLNISYFFNSFHMLDRMIDFFKDFRFDSIERSSENFFCRTPNDEKNCRRNK